MKKLPLGIQTFRKIVEEGCVYVDKTKYIYDLIAGGNCYFLSRPRRFGKSLLVDTISEVFLGNRELFEGLWIHGSDYGFEPHPVIKLDMSRVNTESPEVLKSSVISVLNRRIADEGLDIVESNPPDIFASLIIELHKKYNRKIAVLIDEYDKPILDHLENLEVAEANRQVMRGFYGILKSMDPYLKFTFLTGVSKFTKTSVFSELNNLTDLTLEKDYAGICGIPVEELEDHFGEHIKSVSGEEELAHYDSLHDEILRWYDGYSWDGKTRLLNPFGLLSFFRRREFTSFWFESGSPKFLIDMVMKNPEIYTKLRNKKITSAEINAADVTSLLPESLFFQTGYLTIKEKVPFSAPPVYVMDMPNREVREAFNEHILIAMSKDVSMWSLKTSMLDSLRKGEPEGMVKALRGVFKSIPYEIHVDNEAYYHSLFYTVMNLLGFDIEAEVSVSDGRADAVLELPDKAYVIEFKHEKCPKCISEDDRQELFEKALDEGMSQIMDRGYHEKFEGSGKDVRVIALAVLGRGDLRMRAVLID